MFSMTYNPARDTVGRFAPQDHTAPELGLTEQYLDDDTDGADFNVHDFYDAEHATTFDAWVDDSTSENAHNPDAAPSDPDELFAAWLEESRTPQGMDEYFDRPNPAFAAVAPGDELPVGAWGNAQPF